jgi:hypothetical protein
VSQLWWGGLVRFLVLVLFAGLLLQDLAKHLLVELTDVLEGKQLEN